MLTSDQFDALVEPIVALYDGYIQSVINDIARRLAGMDYATATAAWQMQRLAESGAIYDDILSRLEQLTGKSDAILREMFETAGVQAMRFDDAIYRAAGLEPLPLNLSPAMAQVLAAGLRKTQGVARNLTTTTAITGQDAFIRAADLAYMQISTGAFDYNSAIRQAVKQVASDGLDVITYTGGRRDQLDVAMRRTVLTGVGQTAGELQMRRADEMGADLVQTSAHIGARNRGSGPANHESWQGRVFSRSGASREYPGFITETGYGTGEGLAGYNCRHSFYPFFEGISENAYKQATLDDYAGKTVTYQGREISVYDATQKQRYIERGIRHWKRQAGALDAAGLDASFEQGKVRAWQAKMRDFTRQTGLQRQRERELVAAGQGGKKTIGFSFLSGDSRLTTTAQARKLGEAPGGWSKYEKIFRDKYLERFRLEDDVERTIGFWGGPEPSFNAHIRGAKTNVIEMAKAWGKDYNQQGVALLFPNPKGGGGKLLWDFGRKLSDTEWDIFFKNLDDINKEFGEQFNDYFGATVKGMSNIEYWYGSKEQRKNAFVIFRMSIEKSKLPASFSRKHGFDFLLLEQGKDY